jgi:hypothetical protein
LTAINLNDELCRFAVEIYDIVADRLLTAKCHIVKLLSSQLTPQEYFSISYARA